MAVEQPASPKSTLLFGAVLLGTLALYLVVVSTWYWQCEAQIDPDTLMPVECWKIPPASCAPTLHQGGQGSFEQQEWPCFGAGNSTFDRAQFWGSDFVSEFFSGVLGIAASVAKPTLTNNVVPMWNESMKPHINRLALGAVLTAIYMAVLRTWAKKDLYP